MGALSEIFSDQLREFPRLTVPAWIPPLRDESLRAYARRIARVIDPGKPCIIGGTSFGGMVAVEMRRHLDCRGCILIAAVRSPANLPLRIRALRPLSPFFASWSFRLATTMTPLVTRALKPFVRPAVTRFLRQVARADHAFLRWTTQAILRWSSDPHPCDVPIRHIHGRLDHTLPWRCAGADEVIDDGGHLIVMTHAERVNAFIRAAIAEFATPQARPAVRQ